MASVCRQSSFVSGYLSVVISSTLFVISSVSSKPCLSSCSCLLIPQCVLVFGFTTKLSFKFYIKHFELFESETGLELKYSEALLLMHPINLSSFCSNDHLYGDKMRLICVRKLVSSPFIFYQMSASLVSMLTIFFLYTNALPTCQFIWFFVIELFNFYF